MDVFANFESDIGEPCASGGLSGYFLPPTQALESPIPRTSIFVDPASSGADCLTLGDHEGRLAPQLRRVLQLYLADGSPPTEPAPALALLWQSAAVLYRADRPGADPGLRIVGTTIADLAVSGRRAYARLLRAVEGRLATSDLVRVVARLTRDQLAMPGLPIDDPELRLAAEAAVMRAFNVAWAIRGPARMRERMRPALGWIAVSGEDDLPDFPVNVPSAPYQQFRVPFRVPLIGSSGLGSTRCMIATPGNEIEDVAAAEREWLTGALPVARPVALPADYEVYFYIHGHSARLEEAQPLAAALHEVGRLQGRKAALIALDLPVSGYCDRFDHEDLGRLPEVDFLGALTSLGEPSFGGLRPTPLLNFLDQFVVDAVEALDRMLTRPDSAGIMHRLQAVLGGSLGGNMGLRLAGDGNRGLPVNHKVVAWSPASVWPSMADEPFPPEFRAALVPAAVTAMPALYAAASLHLGGVPTATIPAPVVLAILLGTIDSSRWAAIPLGKPYNSAQAVEARESRGQYFSDVFRYRLPLPAGFELRPQPEYWYRDGWEPCKRDSIQGSFLERVEIYDQSFRRWHWRMALEQLVSSHRDRETRAPPRRSGPRFERIHRPLLWLAGQQDNDVWIKIHDHSLEIANQLTATEGRGVFLRETGHSIHSERPKLLATQILSFCEPTGSPGAVVRRLDVAAAAITEHRGEVEAGERVPGSSVAVRGRNGGEVTLDVTGVVPGLPHGRPGIPRSSPMRVQSLNITFEAPSLHAWISDLTLLDSAPGPAGSSLGRLWTHSGLLLSSRGATSFRVGVSHLAPLAIGSEIRVRIRVRFDDDASAMHTFTVRGVEVGFSRVATPAPVIAPPVIPVPPVVPR